MKDVHIPNGYFHLWHSFVCESGIFDLVLADRQHEREQLELILQRPRAGQSSHAFFIDLIESTQKIASPNFIFQMAQDVKPDHFGVLGYMATRSESIAEALQYILKFSRLVIDGDEITPMQIHQQGQYLVLTWAYIDATYTLINEVTTAMMIQLAREILPNSHFPLHKVMFAHESLMPIHHYQKFYACELLFNQTEYGLMLNVIGLDLKPQQADSSLMQLLIQQAEEAIASKPRNASLEQQLHLIVAEFLRLERNVPKIEDIADELHLSVRTLQRQLSVLGTSFKRIVELERMKCCEQLMLQQYSFTEIAQLLGYSDQSALARAYKSLHGQTMLQAKKRLNI